jgi:medium-chain acyl-[acyl-carrier-protein] hydrolase
MKNMWITPPRRSCVPQIRLFCFPYAGGGASIYREWQEAFPRTIEVRAVQLPGRGNRLREEPLADINKLLDAIADGLSEHLDLPFAFFGHSMGAMLIFELARKLRHRGCRLPLHLFVSGRRAPSVSYAQTKKLHTLPERELMDEIRLLNGTPAKVLVHKELMDFLLPAIRADFSVCENYAYSRDAPLECDISAFGGIHDGKVNHMHLEAWKKETNGSFSCWMLPGDHFFLHAEKDRLIELICRQLNYRRLTDATN